MSRGRGWNEENLSENPAVAHLQRLGCYTSYLEVLDAERESLKQVVIFAQTEGTLFTDLVGLYKAMGGGWGVAGDTLSPPESTGDR